MFLVITASTARSSSGAELDQLAASVGQRDVAGRQVERIASFEDLFVIGEAIGEPALQHVAPVRARAGVTRQAL